jgi:hypothetical protein
LEAGIDFERANAARIYDFLLGGAHNFAVDREQAGLILARHPDMARVCRENRAYLARAVRWCLESGIDQFLDLGSGVPTVGNVHEIAHAHNPAARVAYVDFEPVAVASAREISAGLESVTVTAADLREPEAVLGAPGVAGLLDFTRPVALLAVAVLRFVSDDLVPILAGYRAALAPASVIVLSHGSHDWDDPALAAAQREAAAGYHSSATPAALRTRAQLYELLTGLDLLAPGLVDLTAWPTPTDPQPVLVGAYAAVARVPHPHARSIPGADAIPT